MWDEHFGTAIWQGKLSWRAKKKRLAEVMAGLHGKDCADEGDDMEIDEPRHKETPVDKTDSPFSDEWFSDLDDSIAAITNTFDELRVSRARPESHDDDVHDAERGLFYIQRELVQCLAALRKVTGEPCKDETTSHDDAHNQGEMASNVLNDKGSRPQPFYATTPDNFKHNEASGITHKLSSLGRSPSPGDQVMKQLFRWWRPCGPDCVRETRRPEEARLAEVDGRLIQ